MAMVFIVKLKCVISSAGISDCFNNSWLVKVKKPIFLLFIYVYNPLQKLWNHHT